MELVFPKKSNVLHIFLLIKAGEVKAGVNLYNAVSDSLLKTQKNRIDEFFASMLLCECPDLKDNLPEDSLVCLHYPYAEDAMQVYCKCDDESVGNALKKITFRSPYKHFRLALSGMLAFHEEPQNALPFFAKIASDSPFLSLTAPYLRIAEKKKDTVEKTTVLEGKIINLLGGYDKNSVRLFEALNKPNRTAAALYQTLVVAGKHIGQKQLREIGYRILPHADLKIRDFEKRSGQRSHFEKARLIALMEDIDETLFYERVEAWQDVIDILAEQDKCENSKKIAFIY